MARTEVGSAYVSIYPDTSDFSNKLAEELGASSLSNSMSNAGEAASKGFETGFSAITVALGNIASQAVSAAVDLFTRNLDRGIQRLDTLKNFPKLMQTFGYSFEDAEDSIVAVREHLDGLPGATDDVLRLVQAISDSTGSLDLATSTGLAFNDMLTAAGADSYTSMMAMRMFDQMMGGAEFTTMRWMALVSKMPLQMNRVAQAILGAGASAQDLGNALQDGEVTMKDVAEAMTELAPSFEKQARAMSYGVGTALRNFSNRMAAGVADILDQFGQENIAKFIDKVSYGIRDAMYAVGDAIQWLIVKVKTAKLDELFGQVFEKIQEAISNIDWEPVKAAFRTAIDALVVVLQWILDNGDIVKSILMGVGVAIAAMGIIGLIENIKKGLFGAEGIITMLMANPFATIVVAIGALVAGLVYFFTQTERGREIWAKFMDVVSGVISTIGDAIGVVVEGARVFLTAVVQTIIDAVSFIWNAVSGFIEGVIGFVQGLWSFLVEAWDAGSQLFSIIADYIGGVIAALFDVIGNILKTAVDAWDSAWTFIDWVCQGIIDVIAAIVGAVVDAAKQFVRDCKNTFDKVKNLVNTFRLNLSRTWENIKTTVSNVWNNIKTTIGNVVNNIKTTVTNGFNNVKSIAERIWNNIKNAITCPIEAAQGVVSTVIGGIQNVINSLTGKKVDVGVNDSRGTVSNIINGIQQSINGLTGKTVTVSVQKGGINGINVKSKAAGGGWYMETYAAGGIADRATVGIFGEAGSEALIPLSNRNKVRPFAQAVAMEMNGGGTTNNYYIDGNLVAADAQLASALEVVAQRVSSRRRMGVA